MLNRIHLSNIPIHMHHNLNLHDQQEEQKTVPFNHFFEKMQSPNRAFQKKLKRLNQIYTDREFIGLTIYQIC